LGYLHKQHSVQRGFCVPTQYFVMEYHGREEFMELMKMKFNLRCVKIYGFSSRFKGNAVCLHVEQLPLYAA
jgi:hypothetical protein